MDIASMIPRTAPYRSWLVALALIAGISGFACTTERDSGPPNVFVVVVDTLRADRFGGPGREPSLTPYLDTLAETSTVFHNAWSTSAWTSPAVASLFTSRYPSQHRVVTFDSVLPEAERTLAEILAERGYRSGGFSSNQLIGRSRGFQQGFDFFLARGTRDVGGLKFSERSGEAALRALEWIDAQTEASAAPLFVYLHVIDPHVPYAPDAAAMDQIFEGGERPDPNRVNQAMRSHLSSVIDEETRRAVRGLYDAEVRSTDIGLEFFFSELASRALLENSVVVITSDHGEELWEHDMFGHHHSLNEEVIRVPALIRTPGQSSRRDVFEGVSLLDIAPTLVDLLGAGPVEGFEGRSLVPWLTADAAAGIAASQGIVSELLLAPGFRRTPHERTVVIGDAQLIRNFDGVEHFVDLSAGPNDRSGAGIAEDEKQALREALDRFIDRYTDPSLPAQGARERIELDEEGREELRALGYIE